MAASTQSIMDTRRHQMFPTLEPAEIERLRRFAIGDVRSGSAKRVAAAVGEGAQAVSMLHGFLAVSGWTGNQPI